MEGPVAPPPKLPSFKEMINPKNTGESDARSKANKTVKAYTEQYELLKVPKQENKQLRKEADEEKTKTDVLNRLSQFKDVPTGDWVGILLDIFAVILGLVLVYLVFSKLFTSATEVVVESSDVTI